MAGSVEKVRFLLGWSASISLGTATKNHRHVQWNVISSSYVCIYIYIYIYFWWHRCVATGILAFSFLYCGYRGHCCLASTKEMAGEPPQRGGLASPRGWITRLLPLSTATVICTRFLRGFLTWPFVSPATPLPGSLPARYRVQRERGSGTNWAASFGTSSARFVREMAGCSGMNLALLPRARHLEDLNFSQTGVSLSTRIKIINFAFC